MKDIIEAAVAETSGGWTIADDFRCTMKEMRVATDAILLLSGLREPSPGET